MPELAIFNPVKRRRASTKKRRPAAKRASPSRKRRVRRNPAPVVAAVKRKIRRARVGAKRRVRRNPTARRIGMGSFSVKNVTAVLKDAAIGGAGAVAVDFAMGQLNKHLPANMQPVAGEVGVNDAIRAAATLMVAHFAPRSMKGIVSKAAAGALTVQAYGVAQILAAKFAPSVVNGVGYASPAAISRGTARISPIVRPQGVNAYMAPGSRSPLLAGRGGSGQFGAFTAPGSRSPLLSRAANVAMREGVKYT